MPQFTMIKVMMRLNRWVMYSPLLPDVLRRVQLNAAMNFIQPRPLDLSVDELKLGGVPCLHIRSKEHSLDDKILYYLHGGGYHFCTPSTHRNMIYQLCRAGKVQAYALDYRLAPEHVYPCALDDSLAGYKDLLAQGHKPENIVIGGDSAGGGLTLATLQVLRGEGIPQPAAAFCISPWTDLTLSGESFKTNAGIDPMLVPRGLVVWAPQYGGENLKDPLVSPLFGDFANMPPILMHTGEVEILLDDSRRLQKKAEENGWDIQLKVWPEMIHVFQFFSRILPDARRSILELGQFMQEHLKLKEQKESRIMPSNKL